MAAEDINVEYSDKAVTASFDTESRTLRMPVFKDISDDSTDLFLGHEVGHALYTPQGEIHKVLEKGGTYKNFVNIVEDARIEKMIQNKFPGLRRCFFGGYNELMERDFFGTNGQDINDYNFIDRLNIHFKAGVRAGVDFSAEESIFVNRMENLRSWEDTIALSDDLYEYCKAREEEPLTDKTSDFQESAESDESEPEDSQTDSDGSGEDTKEEKDSSQGQGDSGEETDDNSESDSDSDTDDNRESDSESDTGGVEGDGTSADNGTSTSGKKGTDSGSADELTSKTQESFDSKLEDLVDTESIRTYYNIPNVDLDKVIVPMSEVHQNIDKGLRDKDALDLLELASKKFKEFSNEQKSIISYLIKEFEMRKSADEHKRTKVARTGILNPNKLHAFKFSEDIFLRNSVVSDGKNHGFVMFVDWSGSMISQMADTIDQLMMLALFCKKAQIPFDVYAFTTAYGSEKRNSCGGFYQFDDLKEGDLGIIDNFNLLHLISSTLKTSAFNRSMTYVSYLRHMFAYHTSYNSEISWELIGDFMLGGTPLNEAIITAMSIVPQFQKNNNVQIVNTIFLTDGQGQNKQYRYEADTACFQDPRYDRNSESVIVDPVTKKHYNSRVTDKILLEILKDRTGTTLAGFFISTSNKKSFSTDCWHMNVPYDQISRLWDSMKANGFCVVETNGYDEYYVLASKNLRIENNGLAGIKSDMTKGKMKNAFIKAQQGKIANKKMLSKFAELVA